MCVESLLSNEHTRRVFAPLWLWMYLNVSCSAHHLRLGGAAFMLSSGLIIVQLRRVVWCGVSADAGETYSGCCSPRSHAVIPGERGRGGEREREPEGDELNE